MLTRVRTFLVEAYLAGDRRGDLARLAARARAIEAALPVRYVGSFFVVDDEICFHVFEAPSAAVVAKATRAADIPCDRVAETVCVLP